MPIWPRTPSSDTHRRYAKVEKSGYVQFRHRAKAQQSAKLRRRKGHGSSITMANAKVERAGVEHDHGEWSEPPGATANANGRRQGSAGAQRQCRKG